MTTNRHDKGAITAGQAVGGRFAPGVRAEADGSALADVGPDQTEKAQYTPVTVSSLQKMDSDGTLHEYTSKLKDDYDLVIEQNLDLFKDDFKHAMGDIDTRDFLLRVLEDDVVKSPQFASGEDDRVPYYLNHAIDVVNARGADAQRKAIRWGVD